MRVCIFIVLYFILFQKDISRPEQCIYAAIVYMHRFLIIQSPTRYYLLVYIQKKKVID